VPSPDRGDQRSLAETATRGQGEHKAAREAQVASTAGAFEGAREPSVYGNDEKYDAVYKGEVRAY